MDEPVKGRLAMIVAGLVWGLSPIFYKFIENVPPVEIFCHRVISSFAVFFLVMLVRGRAGEVPRVLVTSPRKFATIALAASMISVNWLLFIVAVQIDRATEASLGYFIFPLIAVFLGAVVLGERLSAAQWIAVVVAAAAVTLQLVLSGTLPWIALILASTFAGYGLVKKQISDGPIVTVAAESLLLTPVALCWLVGVHQWGWSDFTARPGGYFGNDITVTIMFAVSGIITAGPLVLLSYGTRRLRYSESGILLYTNPALQFLVAVLIFAEPFSTTDLAAFMLIWLALVLFSLEARITSGLFGARRRATPRSPRH